MQPIRYASRVKETVLNFLVLWGLRCPSLSLPVPGVCFFLSLAKKERKKELKMLKYYAICTAFVFRYSYGAAATVHRAVVASPDHYRMFEDGKYPTVLLPVWSLSQNTGLLNSLYMGLACVPDVAQARTSGWLGPCTTSLSRAISAQCECCCFFWGGGGGGYPTSLSDPFFIASFASCEVISVATCVLPYTPRTILGMMFKLTKMCEITWSGSP